MKDFRAVAWFLVLLIVLVEAPGLAQDEPPKPDPGPLFPVEVGKLWTYSLTVRVGKQAKSIKYTTRVARTEEVEGVGTCAVFESRLKQKLLNVDWFRSDGVRITNPKRQLGAGGPTRTYPTRVLLEFAAVKKLQKDPADQASWDWKCSDGSTGKVTLQRRETVKVGAFGDLDCVVILDMGTHKVGKAVMTQERKIWLAPGMGMVKETSIIRKNGEVSSVSETVLEQYSEDGKQG